MKSFSVFAAARYLKPRRSFVLVIAILSIMGVMFGVGVPLAVISIMNGFERDIQKMFLDFDPHIVVMPEYRPNPDFGEAAPTPWDEVLAVMEGVPGVEAVSPFIQGQLLIEFNKEPAAPYVRAFFADDPVEIARIEEWLVAGSVDLSTDNIVLSRSVADRLGVFIGDQVTAYSRADECGSRVVGAGSR